MTTLSHFSNSYSAHEMLFLSFLTSLSPLAFSRPMYIFVGPVTHYSCRLGLIGFFAIYSVNSLWSSSLGSFVCWASTNGPQQELIKKAKQAQLTTHFYFSQGFKSFSLLSYQIKKEKRKKESEEQREKKREKKMI